ncbi:MAG: hypothetical protein K2J85_02265, partial [Anaeroplasmataceae bacterium]|nr:hypothetical protein [Anaeroplasmataceae bacterium]
IGILSISALVSCKTEGSDPEKPKEDYSKLTFAEIFEIQEDKDAGMPGMTMAQLTSTNSEAAFPAQERHAFYLKAKYDVEITGVSFSMKPEKVANYIGFDVYPIPRNRTYIFQTGTDPYHVEAISTGSNTVNKTYSFTYTLKKGNSIGFNSILLEEEHRFFINATFYNFKLNYKVVQK